MLIPSGPGRMRLELRADSLVCKLVLAALVLLVSDSWGQQIASSSNNATIRITGIVAHPLVLNETELLRLKRATITVADEAGVKAAYAGVPVVELLRRAGAPLGNQLRGPQMKLYVLVKAADGYAAVFALPEFDPGFTDRLIILADRRNAEPLSAREGAFRIIIPGEKRHARWVRQVTTLELGEGK